MTKPRRQARIHQTRQRRSQYGELVHWYSPGQQETWGLDKPGQLKLGGSDALNRQCFNYVCDADQMNTAQCLWSLAGKNNRFWQRTSAEQQALIEDVALTGVSKALTQGHVAMANWLWERAGETKCSGNEFRILNKKCPYLLRVISNVLAMMEILRRHHGFGNVQGKPNRFGKGCLGRIGQIYKKTC